MRYAVSDIHGCYVTFRTLIEDKIQLNICDELYLLGDYIDRGPKSKEVIDFILELNNAGYNIKTLKGNHEQMLLDYYDNKENLDLWIKNGASSTLTSYDIDQALLYKTNIKLPQPHITLIKEMDYYQNLPDFLLSHAGFNFKHKNILEDKQAMLWIRGFQVDSNKLIDKKIIHGHTPCSIRKLKENIENNSSVICIDTGCVYDYYGMGYLTALNLDTLAYYQIKNLD